jgi:DNA-binding transcriptional LysR family regulator
MRLLISRHLENFLALYDARNMHLAAEKKGISQPALSKSLKVLEESLGATLFERTHRGLEPTSAGELLHRHACAIDQEARFASLDISKYQSTLGGRIKIGVGPVLAVSTFPQALADFHHSLPGIEISVETGISNFLYDGLMNADFDVIAAAIPELELPENFTAVPLFTTNMVVICRKDHPMMAAPDVTRDSLGTFRRVGFVEDREFEKKSRRFLGGLSDQLQPILQTTSLTIMFGILAATDYYAIVSDLIVPRARREGLDAFSPLGGLWQLDIDLICKTTLVTSHPLQVLRQAIEEHSKLG